jgi:hypothetical protein
MAVCNKNDIPLAPTGFVPGKLMQGFAIYCLIAVSAYLIFLFIFPFLGKVTLSTVWWINIILRFIFGGTSLWALILFLRRGYIKYLPLVIIGIAFYFIDLCLEVFVLANFKEFEALGVRSLGMIWAFITDISILTFFIIYLNNQKKYLPRSMNEIKSNIRPTAIETIETHSKHNHSMERPQDKGKYDINWAKQHPNIRIVEESNLKGWALYCVVVVFTTILDFIVTTFFFGSVFGFSVIIGLIINGLAAWALITFLRRSHIEYRAVSIICLIYFAFEAVLSFLVVGNTKLMDILMYSGADQIRAWISPSGTAVNGIADIFLVAFFIASYPGKSKEYASNAIIVTAEAKATKQQPKTIFIHPILIAFYVILFLTVSTFLSHQLPDIISRGRWFESDMGALFVFPIAVLTIVFIIWGIIQFAKKGMRRTNTIEGTCGTKGQENINGQKPNIEVSDGNETPALSRISPSIAQPNETDRANSDPIVAKNETKVCLYCHANVPEQANWCPNCNSAF